MSSTTKVVYTDMCGDLVHKGHIKLIERCKNYFQDPENTHEPMTQERP